MVILFEELLKYWTGVSFWHFRRKESFVYMMVDGQQYFSTKEEAIAAAKRTGINYVEE